ncbi:hypothetical protein ABIC09_007532 [Bradyrhizobium sp. S3.12.5]
MPRCDSDNAACETLRLIGADPQNWAPDRDGIDHTVPVGGGQSGTTFASALRRARTDVVAEIDVLKNGAGGGQSLTFARMYKLCTAHELPGSELGSTGIRFRAGCENRSGAEPYDALDQIPRLGWTAYLNWDRKTLGSEAISRATKLFNRYLHQATEQRPRTSCKVFVNFREIRCHERVGPNLKEQCRCMHQ